MKRIEFFTLTFLLVVSISINVHAQNVDWMGITWNPYASASLSVDAMGDLNVSPVGSSYGAAHYNTPLSFRSASTPWVRVSFIDNLSGRIQLWMEDENYTTPNGGAWTQFGAWDIYPNYMIYWWDYDSYLTDNTTGWGWYDTGIARSTGEHTMQLAMRSNGTVDYILDGSLVKSTTDITPNYFGDIYLASRYNTGIFTNYQTGTDYTPIPEPGSFLLLSLGILSIGFVRRFKSS